ncbi:uncharacterized protein LOC101850717 [Aplysia californica]|uniref:Uncharacterized protein LOC101850717 n=1 Tax=Aplysia californica TaxID=6500 RepID=A0ABM0JP31_APLCA|nr:uncharacterized protein LOC101850717 [Aplysia californica]
MGCGGYSKINKPDVNGAVYRKITKEEVLVEMGRKVRVLDSGPTIIFVYGGPGSKKGRLVSELVEVFDFTFVNVEKIMLQKVAGEAYSIEEKDENHDRKESVQELKKMLEDDPTSISLSWILHEVTAQVDRNPQGRYLVDMMPNLKYLIRTATFSQDCSSSMEQFEQKYPISFAVYFSLNMGSKSKTQKKVEEEVKEETEEDKAGFQSDEVDLSRTKRRQSMFENSVRSLLDYFQGSDRLMHVDVSSKNADAISSRTCEVLSRLSLQNLKLVNTVLIFVFDAKSVDPDLLQENDIEFIRLERPGTRLSVASLEDAIRLFVNQLNHKEHKTFVVDLSSTNITKHTEVEVSKSAIVFVNEANIERYFDIPGCQGLFKAVSSLENAVCVFPMDTNPNLCKKIAVTFNNEFSNPREKADKDIL